MDVALASCRVLPEPDPDELLLVSALRRVGVDARVLAWDDPRARFDEAATTILRSTWNYAHQPDAFLAWLESVAPKTALWNSLPVVRWSLHKRYLLDLEGNGVPIVPTVLVPRGHGRTLADVAPDWDHLVVKPAVSAGSRLTQHGDRATLEAHFEALVAQEDVLVQPYLDRVEDHGERSLVWIDGEITHAMRKSRRFAGDHESVAPVPFTDAERSLASRAMAAVEGPLLYGRIDTVLDAQSEPVVMELELVEPSLFLAQNPAALERFVAAIARL